MAGSIFDTRPQDVDMSMLAAASTTPDAHAKVMDMSFRLKVAPDVVARNPQWAERQLNQTIDSQALIKSHPATAKYLADPNNASVSRDEIIQQMAIEDTLRDAELLEPGLFGKDVRDTLVKQLREKGRNIEFVDTPSEWFKSPLLESSPGAAQAGMANAYMGMGGMAGTYVPVMPEQMAPAPADKAEPPKPKTTELPTKPMGAWERLASGAAKGEQIPFFAAIPEIAQVAELTAIAHRIKDKTATDDDWLKLLEYDAEMRRGTTFGGQVAGILSQLPAFAGEFAATGGVYTAGRKAATGAGLYAAKKLLNKSAREVAESAVLRSTVKLTGLAVGSAARATVGMPQRVALDTMQRLVPQMQFTEDEQGQIEATISEPNDGFASALRKAILNQSIEVGTESAGAFIGKITGLNAVKAAVMTRWLKLNPTSGWSQFQALLKKGGWDGILEEFGEERLGDILRAATGLEKLKIDPEQYMVEMVAFAALPVGGMAVSLPGMIRYSNQSAQRAQAQVDFFNELGQQSLQSKTRERVPGLLSYLGTLATQDGPVESVFHPVASWDAYWASKQVDPRQATIDLLGSAEAYDSAKATGHDIEIPLASYVEKIAPTEHNAAMSQELRLGSAEAPNVREMAAGTQAVQQQMQELLKLNQDFESLTVEQGTVSAEIAQLEQQIQEAQAAQPARQQRLQEIAAQIPEALASIASGQAAPADMQALVSEYQSLQEQESTAQTAQQRIQELGARQQEIAAQVEQIQQRERDARQTNINVAPEVRAMADTTFDTLMSTGRYKSERAARAHAAIYSRMAYVQALRNGMTLEEFNERFPLEITNGEATTQGASLSQEDASRDAEYMAAVEAGDMETAQRLVSEAAKAAGYTIGPVWHGTYEEGITVFEPGRASAIYFTDDKDYALEYGPTLQRAFLRGNVGDLTDPNSEAYKLAVKTFNEAGGWSLNDDAMEGRDSPDFNPKTDNTWEIFDNPDIDIGFALVNAGFDAVKLQERGAGEGERNITSYAVFDPSQIKSAEPVTRDADGNVIPLSQRFNPEQDSILFQKQRDAQYMAAVEAGDMEAAQRLVNAAARAAGYTVGPVYHGTSNKFDVFKPRTAQGWGTGVYFASDRSSAEEYGPRIVTAVLKINRPFSGVFSSEDEGKVAQTKAYKQAQQEYKDSPRFVDDETGELDWRELYQESGSFAGDLVRDLGYDAVVQEESPHLPSGSEIVVFDSSQIKSAEPVTRDADGNVIPLSERFNPDQDSILYQKAKAPKAHPLDLAPAEYIDGRGTVSTRQPTSVKAQESEKVLQVNLEAVNATEVLKGKVADGIRNGITKGRSVQYITNEQAAGNDDQVIRAFIDLCKGNLRWLWNQFPAQLRDRAKLWYVGANKIADACAERYSVTTEQAAGVFAVLSPQKDWFQNVSMGERVMQIWERAKTENFVFTQELFDYVYNTDVRQLRKDASTKYVKKAFKPRTWSSDMNISEEEFNAQEQKRRKEHNASEKKRKEKPQIAAAALAKKTAAWDAKRVYIGKRWSELGLDGRARLFRALDETTSDRSYRIILPEGGRGEVALTGEGQPAVVAWSSYNFIAKALSILDDGSIANISEKLGNEHKVRNFFNNISDPHNKKGYVTIDTHAVAAALLNALSGSSEEVADNFGGAGGDSLIGISGTYGVYAEAYNELAEELTKELGVPVLAREVQSVTWEAVRLLFPKEDKTSGKLNKNLDAIWKEYADEKRTIEDVRRGIWNLSGGIRNPSWSDTGFGFDAQQGGVASGIPDGGPFVPLGRRAASLDSELPARGSAKLARGVVRGAEADQEVTLNQDVFPPVADATPLVALHNISEQNLLAAARLGGLAAPSIGVTRPDALYTNFGDITLIGSRDIADPRRNPVFNADAYTVRFPSPEYGKMKTASALKILKPMLAFQSTFRDYTPDEAFDLLVNRGQVERAIGKLENSVAAKVAYLQAKGITVKPVMREAYLHYPWAKLPAFRKYMTQERLDAALAGDEDVRRAMVPVIEEAITQDLKDKGSDQKAIDYLLKSFRNSLSSDGEVSLVLVDRIQQDFKNAGTQVVDPGATSDAVNEALKGKEDEFRASIQSQVLASAGEAKLTIGRKKVPFTLENIVEYMTSSKGAGAEATMTFGEGKARAVSAARISDLQEMRNRAEWQIAPTEDVKAARDAASKLVRDYQIKVTDHYKYSSTFSAMDSSMKALARWAKSGVRTTASLQKALRAEDFENVPKDILELGVEAGNAFLSTPVPYFESKPQRAVALSEFKAAVIPATTGQEARNALAQAGVPVVEYNPYDTASREAAVRQAADQEQALFQRAFHGSPHKFEKFMLDHIGNGEGAQTFGWGLYFAGDREIAEYYRETLSLLNNEPSLTLVKRGLEKVFGESRAFTEDEEKSFVYAAIGSVSKQDLKDPAGSSRREARNLWTSKASFRDIPEEKLAEAILAIRNERNQGQLYEVEIPDNDVLLDWDRPVPEEIIRKVAQKSVADGLTDVSVDEAVELLEDEYDRNGEILYVSLSEQLGGDRQASEFLNSIGIKGIRYLDANSRSKGEGTHNFVIFDDAAIEMLNTFFQRKDNARGSITFKPSERGADRRQFTMRLLKTANESTFIHEAAHYFLETMGELASREGAPEQSRADYAAVMKWLGATDPTSITVEQHETFARSFEAYLMEGKAPAEEVRSLFARMRTWLIRIYRDLTNLNVEMSDEIRGVFDRMVATDTEIQAAEAQERVEPMFGTKPEGMTDQAWERYRKAVEKASMAAREALQARLEKEVLDARTAQRRDEMDLTRAEVLEEYVKKPEYIALHILRFGKMPDDSDIPAPLQAIKLDKESLLYMPSTDEATMTKLRKLGVYRVEGGVSPDAAAQMLGFGSGDELVRALAETAPLKQAVEEETKRRVEAMNPSLLTDREGMQAEAANAVHNEYRDEVIASEMAELQRLIRADKAAVGRVAAMAPAPLGTIGQRILRGNQDQASAAMQLQDPRLIQQIATDMASQILAGMKLRDIRPSLYLAASRRAAMNGSVASAKGNFQTALAAKEQELLNHALYREAKRLQDDAAKQSKYLLRLAAPAAQARLGKAGTNYREQVNAILERFNFKDVPLTQVDRRQRLADWITAQEAAGFTVEIDDAVRDEAFRKDFREMTGLELAAVYEAARQIDHLSKLKNKLLKIREQREFGELMETLVAQVRANTKAKPRQMGSKTSAEQAMESWDGFFAAHRKMASIIREMDGFVDAGPLYWAIIDPINTAGNEEAVETAKATEKLQELFAAYSNDELKRMTKKQVVRGATRNFNLSLEDRLCIALNWGNEDNQRKLVDGYNGLTEGDVLQILDTLTEKDWKFVQSVWDYIDSFWPRSKAKQERVYGIAPEKVQATPVVTKFGTFPGGYYPLKYAGARAEGESDADTAKQMMRGAMVSGTTRRGHLKERVSGVERPIRLDFGVLTQHLTQTIHDLTHHEMLIDVNKILRNRTLMEAIEEHYGEALFRQLRTGLEAVAAGNINSEDRFTRALGHLRGGATIAGLGFNLMTSMQQAFGLTNAIPRVGVKYIAQAVGRWLGSAKDMENSVAWIHSKSDFMRLRGKTQSRDLAEIRSTINPSARTALMDSYFYLIEKGQMLADVPTWLAGYYKAIDEGMTEAQAIALADQTVIDVHGAGQIKDLSAVQRGGPLLKMWSTFYSYFNAAWNLNVELVKKTDYTNPADIGRLMVDMLILNSVPVALNYALMEALRGGAGDDDKTWWKEIAKNHVSYMLGMLVFVRELGGILDGRNYEGPAGGRFFAEAYKLAKQVEQEELDRGFWVSLNKVGGLLFHYPATQAQRTIEGAKSLWEGKTSNPAVLVTGPSKEER